MNCVSRVKTGEVWHNSRWDRHLMLKMKTVRASETSEIQKTFTWCFSPKMDEN